MTEKNRYKCFGGGLIVMLDVPDKFVVKRISAKFISVDNCL
ncbi:MAG: hypothetical protein ACLRMN_02565 [Mediterraneibacter gnavus]|jgi:hypothetical protein